MTKLVTAVAVVQLVEKGVLDLDDDVKEKVEELRSVKVLREMKTGRYRAYYFVFVP